MHHKLQHLGCPKLPVTSFKLYRKRWPPPVFMNLMRDAPVITTKVTVMQHDVVASVRPDLPSVTQQGNQTSHAVADRSQLRRATPVTAATLNDVRTMFKSLLQEYAYWVDEIWVTGTIPPELHGTYYRNGPALHITNPRYKRHTLDGDGMVFSIAFHDGRAYFSNRFVRTKGFVNEQAAGRPLYRNSFTRGSHDGSNPWFNPLDLSFKNVANTGVLPWGGRLYALWEAGLPYQMDPSSLDTVGESRMGGQIRGNTFAAHYRVITEDLLLEKTTSQEHHPQHHPQQNQYRPGTGGTSASSATAVRVVGSGSVDGVSSSRRLVTFSNEYGYGGASAVFYEFDEDSRLLHETRHPLPGIDITLLHDMVVTEHYYVLVVGPVRLDPFKFVTQYAVGFCSIAEALTYDPQRPTRIFLFPRPGRPSGKVLAPRTLFTEPLFVFHNVNGWEVEEVERGKVDGERADSGLTALVFDCVAWDEVSFDMHLFDKHKPRVEGFEGGARMHLTRLTCDLRSGRVERRKLLRRTVEFPMTDPRVTGRPHSVSWFIADAVDHSVFWGPAQGVVRVELESNPTILDGDGGGMDALQARRQFLTPPRQTAAAVRGAAAGASPGVAVDSWYFGKRSFPGEPMFVPRPGSSREGDGWLIVAVHNADTEKADVHIFDAEALSSGPLATLHLPHRLPVSLHGAWDHVYRGPDPENLAMPRWQLLGSVKPL